MQVWNSTTPKPRITPHLKFYMYQSTISRILTKITEALILDNKRMKLLLACIHTIYRNIHLIKRKHTVLLQTYAFTSSLARTSKRLEMLHTPSVQINSPSTERQEHHLQNHVKQCECPLVYLLRRYQVTRMVKWGKVVFVLLTMYHAVKTYSGWRYSATHSLTSALEGDEWSASQPALLRGKSPRYPWLGDWRGPRTGLDAVEKKKIPSSHRESNPHRPDHSQSLGSFKIELERTWQEAAVACFRKLSGRGGGDWGKTWNSSVKQTDVWADSWTQDLRIRSRNANHPYQRYPCL
jgi:hypothetical protein